MATNQENQEEISIIKYYLVEFENKDVKRYTMDYNRAAPSINTLLTIYHTLRHSHAYFRLKVSQDTEDIVPLSDILLNFFTRHIYTSQREFEIRHPCLYQTIVAASENDSCDIQQ